MRERLPPREPYALPDPQESFLSVLHQPPRRLRIGVTTTNPDGSPLHPEVKAAVKHAACCANDWASTWKNSIFAMTCNNAESL